MYFILLITFLLHNFTSNWNGFQVCAQSNLQGDDWEDNVFSVDEKAKLELLRERVKYKLTDNYMFTDFYLSKWLRAKNMNIDNAEKMILQNLKWREENNMKEILNEDFSDVSEDFFISTTSVDKRGHPISIINYGSWNALGSVLQGKQRRLSRYTDYKQETIMHLILKARENGKPISRYVVLSDMDGVNVFQHACPACIQIFIRFLKGGEEHYPNLIGEMIIINAPPVFGLLIEAVKGFISPQLKKSIKIFDSNEKRWMAYLDERIARDQRYENYGGTKVKGF